MRLEIHLKRLISLLPSLDTLTRQFELTESPAFYRLFVRNYFSPHESSAAQSRELSRWNEDTAMNTVSLKSTRRELTSSAAP